MKRTGIVANPGFNDDQGHWVDMSLGSRAKAGGKFFDPWLEALFRDKNPLYTIDKDGCYVPNEAGIYKRQGDVPRAAVLAKLMQSDRLQGEQKYTHVVITDGEKYKARLYLSGDEAFIAEQIIKDRETIYRRSIVYVSSLGKSGKYWALEALKSGVAWESTIRIPNQSVPPQG